MLVLLLIARIFFTEEVREPRLDAANEAEPCVFRIRF